MHIWIFYDKRVSSIYYFEIVLAIAEMNKSIYEATKKKKRRKEHQQQKS